MAFAQQVGQLVPGLEVKVTAHAEMWEPSLYDRERDPDWRHVDAAGHGHFAQPEGETVTYPTLHQVESGYYVEGEPVMEWACRQCNEYIKPGSRPARSRPLERRMEYEVVLRGDGHERVFALSSVQWERFCREVLDTVERVLGDVPPVSFTVEPF